MATVLITGGTGMIGTALRPVLTQAGHGVIILTRDASRHVPKAGTRYASWDLHSQTVDAWAIAESDCIIHLAGANLAGKRWTKKRKAEILNSRVQGGKLLVKALKEIPNKVTTVISNSATGFYGTDTPEKQEPFTEDDPPAQDFLGIVTQQWEAAVRPVEELGKRLVILRLGMVLSKTGGAFPEFDLPLKFSVAPVFGNGKQIVSWVHVRDLVQVYLRFISDAHLQGSYNVVAPFPVSQKQLILEMAKHRKFHLPIVIPPFVLKLLLGELSSELLKSATVSSGRLAGQGIRFDFPTIAEAVAELMRKN